MVFRELHILIFVEFLCRNMYVIRHVLMGPKKEVSEWNPASSPCESLRTIFLRFIFN